MKIDLGAGGNWRISGNLLGSSIYKTVAMMYYFGENKTLGSLHSLEGKAYAMEVSKC